MPKNTTRPTIRTAALATAGLCAGSFLGGTAIAQEAKPEAKPEEKKPRWETSVNAGLTLARGNTKSFLAAFGVESSRKWSRDEMFLGASGGFGESTDVQRADGLPDEETKSADYLKGFAQWNHFFTQRLFGGLRLDASHDDIADVNYRFIVSPLIGYYFIKNATTTLSAEAGPSFIYEQVGGDEEFYVGARLGERFEHKFKNGARVWQMAEIIPQIDDANNFIVNFEVGVEAPITKKFSVRAVLSDTYDNEPAEVTGAAGTRNKLKNDVKLIAGLVYKF